MSQQSLPDGWRWAKLAEVCELVSRGRSPQYGPGSAYAIKSAQVYPDDIRWSDAPSIKDEFAQRYKEIFALRLDDVLLNGTGTGTVGRSAFVRAAPNTVFIPDGHVNLIRTNKRVCLGVYVFYWLQTSSALMQIEAATSGSTNQVELSGKRVEKFLLPLPPLPVQRAIATILDKADTLRRRQVEARSLADRILPAVFEDIFGNPVTNPKKWHFVSLAEGIIEIRNGISRRRRQIANEGAIVLRIQDVGEGWIDYTFPNRIPLAEEELITFELENGDLLLVRVNGNRTLVGRNALFKRHTEAIAFNDHLIRVRFNQSHFTPEFVDAFLRTRFGRNEIEKRVVTSAGNYTINQTGIKAIQIYDADIDKQRWFSETYNRYSERLEKLTRGFQNSNTLFYSLLTRAFTGELTTEWEAAYTAEIAAEVARLEWRPRLALLALVAQRQQHHPEAVGVTSLMKYAFLAQMQGQSLGQPTHHLYNFVPYHFGPFAKDLYTDLEALEAAGWLTVDRATDDDPDAPERVDILLSPARTAEVEAALAELSAGERVDLSAIIEQYGDLSHNDLLDVVYEQYPAYARKSRRHSHGYK